MTKPKKPSNTEYRDLTEYISMGHHLTVFESLNYWWVDTGHADVGPFDTKKEARAHVQRIINGEEQQGVCVN
jgi:hypothetical protein